MGLQISDDGTSIKISDSAGLSPDVHIEKANILRIGSYFQKNTVNGLGNSPYAYGKRTPGRTTKTIVSIIQEGYTFSFDCDEVLNQATWQGCTLAKLQVAVADIQSWIV